MPAISIPKLLELNSGYMGIIKNLDTLETIRFAEPHFLLLYAKIKLLKGSPSTSLESES